MLGAIGGSLVSGAAGSRRKVAVLVVVAALLGSAAAFAMIGYNRLAIASLALAMGAENAVFQRDGEVSIGVTYMTGTLVKLAQGIADAMQGRGRWSWVPYLWLWLGLATGAVAGAGLYRALAMNALWIAAGAAALLSLFAARLSPVETWQSARPDKPI